MIRKSTSYLLIAGALYVFLLWGPNALEATVFEQALGGLIGNILGAIAVGAIFFLYEYIFRKDIISGKWVLEVKTQKSSFNPYIGMTVKFHLLLSSINSEIYGTGEKVWEYVKKDRKPRSYVGQSRDQLQARGTLNRVFFGRDAFTLHLEIDGQKRRTSAIFIGKLESGQIVGKFFSTAADSSGTFKLIKDTSIWST